MKKILISTISILIATASFADTISREQALSAAGRFFGGDTKSVSKTLKIARVGVAKAVHAPIAASDDPTYYAINRTGGGFVILSADNSVENPVFAYSFKGSIPEGEELPANMRWWFDDVIGEQVSIARASGVQRFNMGSVPLTAGAPVVQYTTASWDQGAPYNRKSPKIKGLQTITGCVATAAAIKCRYHEWPKSAEGTTEKYSYTSNYGTITIGENELGREYDYSKMPLKYTSRSTSEEKDEVAALMYDLGTGCKMEFGLYADGGSAAYTADLAYALRTHFHYDSRTECFYKSGTNNIWISKLETELDNNGPIIYGGVDSNGSGGHQFLFDGYTDDHYFHVNWGWSGDSDCYVTVTSLIPDGESINYKNSQDAILNCRPDRSAVYTSEYVAGMTSVKYENRKLTVSNKEKFDCIISLGGKTIISHTNQSAGSSVTITLSELEGKGSYTVLIRMSDWYLEIPGAQYSFELAF